MSVQSGTSPGAITSAGTTPAPGGVTSVFGRTGAVIAVSGDYTSTLVTNSSTVVGATVTAALDTLNTGKAALTAVAPVNVTKAAAVVGVGLTAARNDHKHDVDTAVPVATGAENAEGSATSLARSDHVHLTTPYMWVWADAAARLAQVTTANQIGSIGYQTDIYAEFRLVPNTPAHPLEPLSKWAQLPDNRISLMSFWRPVAQTVTVNGVGLSFGNTGTLTAVTPSVVGLTRAQQLWRVANFTTAVAGNFTSHRTAGSVMVPIAGYRLRMRTLLQSSANWRWYFGIAGAAPVANVNPNTFLNCYGFGAGAEANTQHYTNDGAGLAVQTDLGAGYPARTLNIGYEMQIVTRDSQTYGWNIKNLDTMAEISGSNAGPEIPGNGSTGAIFWYASNNTDAIAVSLDIGGCDFGQTSS